MALQTSGSAQTGIRLRSLSHTTIPVRDRYAAARFYVAVFNAEGSHETPPDRVRPEIRNAGNVNVTVRLFDGFELGLFEQDYGHPTLEQSHPHHAFDVPSGDHPLWIEQLNYWGVPYVGPIGHGERTMSVYFNDPDGNNLELHFPYSEEAHPSPSHRDASGNTMLPASNEDWPPPERAAEADRRLEEALQVMRAAGPRH